jgi:K+-sensing histidine kinase KdpD
VPNKENLTHTNSIDFSSVLASSVHDMKNGLCLLIQLIENLSTSMRSKAPEDALEIAKIHYEASRLNSNLLQMLAMYRVNKERLPLNVDEYYLDEVLEELIAKNQLYIDNQNIQIKFDIETDLAWYFDRDLVSNLLNDIFVNALRYTDTQILVTAKAVNEKLEIKIADDGDGYPESMLKSDFSEPFDIHLNMSKTGLGVYFAQLIAQTHEQNGITGYIKLENNTLLKGSIFTLVLP